jgi:hypothetical protein
MEQEAGSASNLRFTWMYRRTVMVVIHFSDAGSFQLPEPITAPPAFLFGIFSVHSRVICEQKMQDTAHRKLPTPRSAYLVFSVLSLTAKKSRRAAHHAFGR